jgi:DNA polymerase-3 subunit delta'
LDNINYFKKLNTLNNFLHKVYKEQKSHAYLLISEDNISASASAKILALNFVCNSSYNLPCFECSNCVKVLNNTALDVFLYPKNKNILVQDIKEIIQTAHVKPLEFEKKIYILNNFSFATISAQNKLLKILEEPPKNVVFILTASSEKAVLPTIASRAKKVNLVKSTYDEIKNILKQVTTDNKKVQIATENSAGNLGKAIDLVKNDKYFEIYEFVLDAVLNMKASNQLLNYTSSIEKDKKHAETYIDLLGTFFRDMLILKEDSEQLVFNKYSLDKLKQASEGYSNKALIEAIKKTNKAKKMLKFNANTTGVIDLLLLGILEDKHKWKQI